LAKKREKIFCHFNQKIEETKILIFLQKEKIIQAKYRSVDGVIIFQSSERIYIKYKDIIS
jgi:hypothetical protein